MKFSKRILAMTILAGAVLAVPVAAALELVVRGLQARAEPVALEPSQGEPEATDFPGCARRDPQPRPTLANDARLTRVDVAQAIMDQVADSTLLRRAPCVLPPPQPCAARQ